MIHSKLYRLILSTPNSPSHLDNICSVLCVYIEIRMWDRVALDGGKMDESGFLFNGIRTQFRGRIPIIGRVFLIIFLSRNGHSHRRRQRDGMNAIKSYNQMFTFTLSIVYWNRSICITWKMVNKLIIQMIWRIDWILVSIGLQWK